MSDGRKSTTANIDHKDSSSSSSLSRANKTLDTFNFPVLRVSNSSALGNAQSQKFPTAFYWRHRLPICQMDFKRLPHSFEGKASHGLCLTAVFQRKCSQHALHTRAESMGFQTIGAMRRHGSHDTCLTTKWSLFKPKTAIHRPRAGLILPTIRLEDIVINRKKVLVDATVVSLPYVLTRAGIPFINKHNCEKKRSDQTLISQITSWKRFSKILLSTVRTQTETTIPNDSEIWYCAGEDATVFPGSRGGINNRMDEDAVNIAP
ncbi:unnamed protein product [Larinioides sclopetarius]|uniref:Uncharacterized protein n=1 Tax=Larinioides sclopetarius TaxID=280406 RepID=A0AAV2ATG4_9ARAC